MALRKPMFSENKRKGNSLLAQEILNFPVIDSGLFAYIYKRIYISWKGYKKKIHLKPFRLKTKILNKFGVHLDASNLCTKMYLHSSCLLLDRECFPERIDQSDNTCRSLKNSFCRNTFSAVSVGRLVRTSGRQNAVPCTILKPFQDSCQKPLLSLQARPRGTRQ